MRNFGGTALGIRYKTSITAVTATSAPTAVHWPRFARMTSAQIPIALTSERSAIFVA